MVAIVSKQLVQKYFKAQNVDVIDNLLEILDNSYDYVIYHDLNNRIVWMNEPGLNEFNTSLDKVQGEYCYKVLRNQESLCDSEVCVVAKVKETGEVARTRHEHSNGKVFLATAAPVRNNTEEIIGVIEILLNITKQVELKEKAEYNKLKNQFFANLSHEFKTPLNLIFSGLKMLDLHLKKNFELENDKKYNNYLDIVNQNSYRLLKLVNNLLDINKIDSNSYDLSLQNHNIVNLIKDIVSSIKVYAEDKNRNLELKTEIKERIIACDSFSIERIMLNLLSNAIKFTDEGDKIIVSIYEKEDELYISVKDTGIGIPEDKQEVIFERFGQTDKSFVRNSEGSGVGLTLVKMLTEMHSGKINLKSEHGKGSEFIIRLPIKELSQDKSETIKNQVKSDSIDKVHIEFSDIHS